MRPRLTGASALEQVMETWTQESEGEAGQDQAEIVKGCFKYINSEREKYVDSWEDGRDFVWLKEKLEKVRLWKEEAEKQLGKLNQK